MDKTFAASLDRILRLINNSNSGIIVRNYEVYEPFLNKLNEDGLHIDVNELQRMFEFLEDEKLIIGKEVTGGDYIQQITFRGMALIRNGGFTRKREDDITERLRLRRIEERAATAEIQMVRLTFLLVAGTVCIALIDFLSHYTEISHTLHSWFCHCR